MNLKQIVADILKLPQQDINEELSPQTFPEWTSLKHIQLITTVEDAYNVKFTLKEMKSLKNYAAFITILKSKGIGDEVFA
ncbi:acyl carrier protein [Paenibacillus sp. sgz500958]|uniref:acyl carrier protein n=1 Tax=Paenibacillus sp. sgz500958 TaxID=3242475 RepID=UPI0036D2ACE1